MIFPGAGPQCQPRQTRSPYDDLIPSSSSQGGQQGCEGLGRQIAAQLNWSCRLVSQVLGRFPFDKIVSFRGLDIDISQCLEQHEHSEVLNTNANISLIIYCLLLRSSTVALEYNDHYICYWNRLYYVVQSAVYLLLFSLNQIAATLVPVYERHYGSVVENNTHFPTDLTVACAAPDLAKSASIPY